jgi:hypothetical protein
MRASKSPSLLLVFRHETLSTTLSNHLINKSKLFKRIRQLVLALEGNHSVSGGGWTHVVLSEPLNGDFQEGILIGRMELQSRSEASSVWGINAER